MDLLYHYSGNEKGFSILNSKTIRLTDIRKSNDYDELLIFYPDIFTELIYAYKENPFPFRYENDYDEKALSHLLFLTNSMLDNNITCGDYTNLVFCLSEKPDLLSQWRGYANDGQGISLGFSKKLLEEFCQKYSNIFCLQQVEYITQDQRRGHLQQLAHSILKELCNLRPWIVDNMTLDDSSPETDHLLGYNFYSLITGYMTDSLKYKRVGFHEEKEWRIYLKNQAYKKPDWVIGNNSSLKGPNGFTETIAFLQNQIEFNITSDNMISYVPLSFSELGENLLKEIWIGPKNKIFKNDLELYLAQHGYNNTTIHYSETSYR